MKTTARKSEKVFCFSWQNLTIAAKTSITKTVVAKFGDFESASPVLVLTFFHSS
jgi:hypothetical protein